MSTDIHTSVTKPAPPENVTPPTKLLYIFLIKHLVFNSKPSSRMYITYISISQKLSYVVWSISNLLQNKIWHNTSIVISKEYLNVKYSYGRKRAENRQMNISYVFFFLSFIFIQLTKKYRRNETVSGINLISHFSFKYNVV